MKKKDRMKNTPTYHYYNANPKGLYTGDCTIRTYALANNLPWDVTVVAVALWSAKTGQVDCDSKTINEVLQVFGNWQKQKEPKHADGTKWTVAELAKKLKKEPNPIVVSVNHHITCIKEGKVWDIWDCSNEYVRSYWIKGE